MSELSSISTPAPTKSRIIDNPDADMDYGTQWDLARSADDVELQRKIVAEELNIPIADVVRTESGNLAYKKDGDLHLVEPTDTMSQAYQFMMDMASKPGSMIGGTAGALAGGIPGAVAGAALGDVAQSGIEQVFEGHDRSAAEYAKSAALEGAFTGAGELLARGGKAAYSTLKNMRAPAPDATAAEALMRAGAQRGIPLTTAEAAGDRQSLNVQSWLRDIPNASSGKIDDFMGGRTEAIESNIDSILATDKSPQEMYKALQTRMKQKRKGLVGERTAAASPYYEAAEAKIADVKPVVEYLAKRISATEGTKIGASLKRIYRGVTRMDGKEAIPKELIGELHVAKMDLDEMITQANRKQKYSTVRELTIAQNQLVDILERASDDYAMGAQVHSGFTTPLNQFDESFAGQMASEKDKPVSRLGSMVFGPTSSPGAVATVRKTMNNDAAFADMTRGHLQTVFNKMNSSSTGDVANIGGLFRKEVFGSKYKRDLLKEALPDEQYQALSDFMEILEATGRGFKANSTTAQRQMMNDRATPAIPLGAPNLAKKYGEVSFDNTTNRMADLLTNELGQKQLSDALKEIKRFARDSSTEGLTKQQAAQAAALGLIGGRYLQEGE